MPRSILVPLDGSDEGKKAWQYALALASRHRSRIEAVGVIDEPGIAAGTAVPIGGSHYHARLADAKSSRAQHEIEEWAEELQRDAAAMKVEATVQVLTGGPHDVIVREAQRVDLVVMARRPHLRFATQTEPDDTPSQVIRDSPRPVILVSSGDIGSGGAMVAYDGSLQAARALASLVGTGLALSIPVHLACVDSDGQATAHMDRARSYLQAHGINAMQHIVSKPEAGSVCDRLIQLARDTNCEMMVIGAYGRSSVVQFFLGSVTKSMLRECPIPLFLDH